MKPTSTLLNLSRGEIIKENDLIDFLNKTPNFWFGQDTHINEPSEL